LRELDAELIADAGELLNPLNHFKHQ
jgi:hypothetical protein